MITTPPETSITPPNINATTPPPTEIDIPSPDTSPRTLLIAISGPSCSGKTSISRLLRDCIPRSFIIHEDDFYKTDTEIPIKHTADGRDLQDWDCFESLDYAKLVDMLRHVKEHGKLREGFESMEDQNAVGDVDVSPETIMHWTNFFEDFTPSDLQVIIVDGFLLFSQDMTELMKLFDAKILLRADQEVVNQRREARKGYVTLEGFWEDPKDYVGQVVWPNYVKDHSYLFVDGNVEGRPNRAICMQLGIETSPWPVLTEAFDWVAGVISQCIQKKSQQ